MTTYFKECKNLLKQSSNTDNPEADPLLRITNSTTYSIHDLSKYSDESCTVKGPDVVGVTTVLRTYLADTLRAGNRLYLEGIGSFYMTLRRKKRKSDPRKSDVVLGGVHFTPDKAFLRAIGTPTVEREPGSTTERVMPPESRRKMLLDVLARQEVLSVSEYQRATALSRYAAQQDMDGYVAEGLLTVERMAKRYFYRKRSELTNPRIG